MIFWKPRGYLMFWNVNMNYRYFFILKVSDRLTYFFELILWFGVLVTDIFVTYLKKNLTDLKCDKFASCLSTSLLEIPSFCSKDNRRVLPWLPWLVRLPERLLLLEDNWLPKVHKKQDWKVFQSHSLRNGWNF